MILKLEKGERNRDISRIAKGKTKKYFWVYVKEEGETEPSTPGRFTATSASHTLCGKRKEQHTTLVFQLYWFAN